MTQPKAVELLRNWNGDAKKLEFIAMKVFGNDELPNDNPNTTTNQQIDEDDEDEDVDGEGEEEEDETM